MKRHSAYIKRRLQQQYSQMACTALSSDMIKAFEGATTVAFDIEGVDLGRTGQISLVQLASSPTSCFLIDLLNVNKDVSNPLVDWLKCILESDKIIKICHDCRMDADALRHILGIELRNVHDTSAWHFECKRSLDVNLNNVLIANGIKPNVKRDSSVYTHNHAFWATRPLTSKMIEWAIGDVSSMFELYDRQITAASCTSMMKAKEMSNSYIDGARGYEVERVHVKYPGKFIGPSGSSIRALQKSTDTLIYPRGNRGSNMFVVYFNTRAGLEAVQAKANA